MLGAWVVPLPAALSRRGSSEIRYTDGSAAYLTLSEDEQWRVPVPLDEVDPAYINALITVEDARFYLHPGVDPIAVARAAAQNAANGAVVSGASTLTMQVARMSEPRSRTLLSKITDALRATQIELRQSKQATLEQYVAAIPFGRNIQGVEAASLWMFGHTAKALSPAEIATLLAIPQDPNDRFPSPAHEPRLTSARNAIAARLWSADPDTLESVIRSPTPTGFTAVPRDIPHAATWLRQRAHTDRRVVNSTLERGVQRVADRVLSSASQRLHNSGIHNGTIIVIEHATGRVRALAGLDGLARWPGSQIAPFDEPRSPGSALKPLLYALAIDKGLTRPSSLVPDVPAHYGAYNPENYDQSWTGMVRMEDALSRSLNVPFVNLLSRFGVEPFLATLRGGGVRKLSNTPGHYGLSAVVGGIEITPIELGQLYTAIAEDGLTRPLTVYADERQGTPTRLFSAGAAWMTRQTLRLRDRPDFPTRANVADIPLQIHWKTGTSFGNRDAWAAGSGQRYTVVVWLGNFDQAPATALVGGETAAPLLFDTLEALHDGLRESDDAPAEVEQVDACALSGDLAGPDCPHARIFSLAGRAPHTTCALHVRAWVADGKRVGPSCPAGSPTGTEASFVQWPSNVARYLGNHMTTEASVPDWADGCTTSSGRAPRILSPGETEDIVLIPGLSADQQEVALEAEGEGELVWYIDGALLARGQAHERQWWTPAPGKHTITVMDASGSTTTRRIGVHEGLPN